MDGFEMFGGMDDDLVQSTEPDMSDLGFTSTELATTIAVSSLCANHVLNQIGKLNMNPRRCLHACTARQTS
jgi:hypothetical protein